MRTQCAHQTKDYAKRGLSLQRQFELIANNLLCGRSEKIKSGLRQYLRCKYCCAKDADF